MSTIGDATPHAMGARQAQPTVGVQALPAV